MGQTFLFWNPLETFCSVAHLRWKEHPARLNSLRQMSTSDLSRRRLLPDGTRKPKALKVAKEPEPEVPEDDAEAEESESAASDSETEADD